MKDSEEHIQKLRLAKLRPTKQRMMISRILFSKKGTFHFTIDSLSKNIKKSFNAKISLATVYNTVHAFKKKGYLKEIAFLENKAYYDTNISDHHHFYDEDKKELIDIDKSMIFVNNIPLTPPNKLVKSVEVMVRVANSNHSQKEFNKILTKKID